jgi:hypothetical protein
MISDDECDILFDVFGDEILEKYEHRFAATETRDRVSGEHKISAEDQNSSLLSYKGNFAY